MKDTGSVGTGENTDTPGSHDYPAPGSLSEKDPCNLVGRDGRPEKNMPNPSRRPRRTIPDAISLARLRGKVQITGNRREALYHFAIVAAGMVAFVRARFTGQILATPEEIAHEFQKDLARLRAVVESATNSRELWLRSRHETWRFFRIAAEKLVEISQDGSEYTGTSAGPTAW